MDYGEPTSVSTLCIEWGGYKDKNGYGVKRWNGRNRKVHRIAWEEAYGPIPADIKYAINVITHVATTLTIFLLEPKGKMYLICLPKEEATGGKGQILLLVIVVRKIARQR